MVHDAACVVGSRASPLVCAIQAICGSARSWLGGSEGGGRRYKCILDGDDPRTSTLVGDVRSFLLAADTHPLATNMLLEALEGVVSSDMMGGGHGG